MFSRVEIGKSGSLVTSPKQEAVLIFDGSTVQVVLRTHFRRGPQEVAWIVPVPAKPTDVQPCADRVFDQLESETAPRFYIVERTGGLHLGCGGAATRSEIAPAVSVEKAGTAGVFQWVVLAARDASELVAWLNENKFAVPPESEAAFARYVAENWHWLAMKVRPELADKTILAPHPVVYTYRETRLVYPLAISRISADLENEIVLYVVAPGRYRCDNWANEEISSQALRPDEMAPSRTNYEEVFRRAADERGGRVFITEFAQGLDTVGLRPLLGLLTQRDPLQGNLKATFLTRLRAVVCPRAMDRDVILVPDSQGEPLPNERYLRSAASPSAPMMLVGAMALVGALLTVRCFIASDQWALRVAGVLLLIAVCILIAL
jgi:hypothetical protein